MDSLSAFFAAIGYIVVGAGAVGTFVWWLFRTFSEKWLNAKFKERLAAYKHEQQKELEHLKFAINAQMDRATKLHQKEFEALPEAWGRLMDAHGIITSVVSRSQSTPDLNGMRPEQLNDFLVNSELAEWQRQLVRDAEDKTSTYRNQFEPFKIAQARTATREFFLYFRKNSIFIREPIKQQFAALDRLMLSALSEHTMNFQHGTREFKSIERLGSNGEKMVEALEAEVQKRLWELNAPRDCPSREWDMTRSPAPPHPMTLANMREQSVRSLAVSCWLCHHGAVLDVDRWPDATPVPRFGRRMTCTGCGIVGADARPNWTERPSLPSLSGSQCR